MSSAIQAYLSALRGRRAAVVGIGVSNTPLIELLLGAGIAVTACDRRARGEFDGLDERLERRGAILHLGADYLDHLEGADVIFRTPGLRPDEPQLEAARARGSVITSEMEAFFAVCPCPIFGITGSDGKTTTTTIAAELLKAAGRTVHVGGNIGRPLLADAAEMSPEDIAVLELSSFQLMTMDRSPDRAVITNLAPNHLDVHKSMEEYIAAKTNIFTHQGPEGLVILNRDNAVTRELAARARGRVTMFSRQAPLEQGVYVEEGAIWVSNGQGRRRVLPLDGILLPGDHNVENYMAAIAAVDGLVPDPVIRDFAKAFGGVAHRIELVRTLDGVRYYNDSIASSPTRTIAGLRSFPEKVILIAGGYDKHIPFDVLGPEIQTHVKALILTGDTAPKIRAAVEGAPGYRGDNPPVSETGDLGEAVATARTMAKPGDMVLLSPACASFDRFKNFAERGDTFKRLVNAL